MKGKAAYKGGVKADDIVVEIDGYPILDSTELRSRIGRTAPGVEIELVVLRDGKKKKLNVVLEELTEDALAENSSRQEEDESQGPLGVNVQELTDQLAKQLGYEDDYGVLVSRVKSGSEAARRGLRRGMLIQTINRMKVESVEDFADVLEEIEPGKAFMMRVKARGEARLVGMRMPMD
jgi:serine protease Do